jgi:EmrB/QacA subfamily drug resistance transporter
MRNRSRALLEDPTRNIRQTSPSTVAPDGRWVALAVLCVGTLMMVLDGTIVNVALPSIQSDLGFTPANLAWVVNGYSIAFGGFLLLAGRLGDLIGSRRVFIAGLCLFTSASLLCGIAWTRDLLVGARFIQGIGGALASSVTLSMVVTMFTEPSERAKAMGYFNFTDSAGGSIGLLLGGLIAQIANWHWVFLVNVPIGVAAVLFALRHVTSPKGPGLREGADVLGAFLITSALMIAVYAVVEIPMQGTTSAHTLIAGTIAALLFVAFIAHQATTAKPLLPLGVFRSRNLNGSNLIQILIVAAMYGFFFLDSLHFRRVLGYNAIMTGLAFLPVTLAIGTLSLGWSARLAMRFGPRRMIVAGIGLAAAGLAWAALTPPGSGDYMLIFPSMLLLGFGLGIAFPSLMVFAMSTATQHDSGVISGLVQTTAEVGGAFGLAILATVAALTNDRIAFGIGAGCAALAVVLAGTVLQPPAVAVDA